MGGSNKPFSQKLLRYHPEGHRHRTECCDGTTETRVQKHKKKYYHFHIILLFCQIKGNSESTIPSTPMVSLSVVVSPGSPDSYWFLSIPPGSPDFSRFLLISLNLGQMMRAKREAVEQSKISSVLLEATRALMYNQTLMDGSPLNIRLDTQTLQQLLPQIDISEFVGNIRPFMVGDGSVAQCLPQELPCDHTSQYRWSFRSRRQSIYS